MPPRNVVLTDHQSDISEELVSSGDALIASEVLREGLRLVEQQERREAGRVDLAAGGYIEADADALDDYLAEIGERAASRPSR